MELPESVKEAVKSIAEAELSRRAAIESLAALEAEFGETSEQALKVRAMIEKSTQRQRTVEAECIKLIGYVPVCDDEWPELITEREQ